MIELVLIAFCTSAYPGFGKISLLRILMMIHYQHIRHTDRYFSNLCLMPSLHFLHSSTPPCFLMVGASCLFDNGEIYLGQIKRNKSSVNKIPENVFV